MSASPAEGLLAIDVGSSRVKLGWFPPAGACTSEVPPGRLPIAAPQLPQAADTLVVSHVDDQPDIEIRAWIEQVVAPDSTVLIASVHPEATERLLAHQSLGAARQLKCDDLALELRVEQPEEVGIDRLLSALAANRVRQPDRPAIVVGAGTATTVNLVAADGAFHGGAILPGIAMSATGLHAGTASLPQVTDESIKTPPATVGRTTRAAMAAGLYWGAVGAIRELVDRMADDCVGRPQLFFTGGGAPQLVSHFVGARHVPHMVLAGIAIAAGELS